MFILENQSLRVTFTIINTFLLLLIAWYNQTNLYGLAAFVLIFIHFFVFKAIEDGYNKSMAAIIFPFVNSLLLGLVFYCNTIESVQVIPLFKENSTRAFVFFLILVFIGRIGGLFNFSKTERIIHITGIFLIPAVFSYLFFNEDETVVIGIIILFLSSIWFILPYKSIIEKLTNTSVVNSLDNKTPKRLLDIVLSNLYPLQVKSHAVSTLNNSQYLLKIAQEENLHSELKTGALRKLTDKKVASLNEITLKKLFKDRSLSDDIRGGFLKRIKDDTFLFEVITSLDSPKFGKIAAKQINREKTLKQVLLSNSVSYEFKGICLGKIINEDFLESIFLEQKNAPVTFREQVLKKIRKPEKLELIFKDSKEDEDFRLYCLSYIRDEDLLFNVLKAEAGEISSLRLRKGAVSKIKSLGYLKSILTDVKENDEVRRELILGVKDFSDFSDLISTFSPDTIDYIIERFKRLRFLEQILQEEKHKPIILKSITKRLLTGRHDNLFPSYIKYSLKNLFTDTFFSKYNIVIQILRNMVAFFGETLDQEFIIRFFPVSKFMEWHKRETNGQVVKPSYGYDDMWLTGLNTFATSLNEKQLIELNWIAACCLSIVPKKEAIPSLKEAYLFLSQKVKKIDEDDKFITQHDSTKYQAEIALNSVLVSLGCCASKDFSYQNFDRDEKIIIEIQLKERLRKSLQQKKENLLDEREIIINNKKQNIFIEKGYFLRNRKEQIEIELNDLKNKLVSLNEEIRKEELNLSSGYFLLRVAKNGIDYNEYVRQGAFSGLRWLLGSNLNFTTKQIISNTLQAVYVDIAEESNIAIYQVRLMPESKIGEINYIIWLALQELGTLQNIAIPDISILFTLIKKICNELEGAINFLTQFPLKLMSKNKKGMLGFYRERGFDMRLLTRYTPPINTRGNVDYRSLEINDLTLPNSLGLVDTLFNSEFLVMPVLYHEYLHYKGLKNEAQVWLLEQFYLRFLIVKNAPKNSAKVLNYLANIKNIFVSVGDYLTLSLLKTEFLSQESIHCLNKLITHSYGEAISEVEAGNIVEVQIQQVNVNLRATNRKIEWDAEKRYPLLSLTEARKEYSQLKKILINRKTQRNIITLEEIQYYFANNEEAFQHFDSWQKFKNIYGYEFQKLMSDVPDIYGFLQRIPINSDPMIFRG